MITIIFASLLIVTTLAFISGLKIKLNIENSLYEATKSRLYFIEKKIDTIDLICMSNRESEGIPEIHDEIKQMKLLIKEVRNAKKADHSLVYIYIIFLISIAGLFFNCKQGFSG